MKTTSKPSDFLTQVVTGAHNRKLENKRAELTLYFERTEKRGKFYDEDCKNFRENVYNITCIERLETMLTNLRNLREDNSPLSKEVAKYEKQLQRGGMYDITKMKAVNALD